MPTRPSLWDFDPDKPVRSSPNSISYIATHRISGQRGIITFYHSLTTGEKEELRIRSEAINEAIHPDAHPNIVQIVDNDVARRGKGQPYIVEDYIDGASLLDTYPGQAKMPLSVALTLCRQMISALQFMHAREISHLGISASHIIKREQGPSDPQAPASSVQEPVFVLTDWKCEQPVSDSYTLEDLAYLAPEIFDRTLGEPGERSDRYALAVVLYRMLTGEFPFKQEANDDRVTIKRRHVLEHPSVNAVHRQLRPVFAKALNRQPGDRYKSAQEFLTDFGKACSQIDSAMLGLQANRSWVQRWLDQRASRRQVVKRGGLAAAAIVLVSWGIWGVEKVFNLGRKSSPVPSPVRVSVPQLGDLLVLFTRHNAPVNAAIPSPNGTRVASVDASGKVILWQTLAPHGVVEWDDPYMHEGKPISAVAWAPAGQFFVTGDTSGGLVLWSVRHAALRYYKLPQANCALAWSTNGNHLLAGGGNLVYIFDDPIAQKLNLTDPPYAGHTNLINALTISQENASAAISGSNDGTAQFWTIETGQKISDIDCTTEGEDSLPVSCAAYSPDGKWLAIASGKTVQVLNATNYRPISSYEHEQTVRSLAWSPDGRSLASGGDDNKVLLSNVDAYGHATWYYTYPGHTDNVLSVAWRDNDSVISAAGKDIHIWRARINPL